MDLETIKTIITVAHCENFAEASRELGYTPSVISKRVAKAEQELGVELFLRGHKSSRLEPTTACEAIMPDLRAASDAFNRAQDIATSFALRSEDNTLHIGSLAKPWPTNEDEIVARFVLQNPKANVLLSKHTWEPLIQGLLKGQYDLAFMALNDLPFNAVGYKQMEVFERFDCYLVDSISKMSLVISAKYPEASLQEATLNEFKDFAIAFNTNEHGELIQNHIAPFLKLADRYGFTLKTFPMNTRSDSAVFMARESKVAIPQPRPRNDIPGVTAIRLTDWESAVKVYCIVPKGKKSTLTLNMIEFIRKHGGKPVSLPCGN